MIFCLVRGLGIAAAVAGALHAGWAAAAASNGPEQLIELDNAYRSSGQTCQDRPWPAAGTLAPDDRLAQAAKDASKSLDEALKRSGYAAARAQLIVLTGLDTAHAAMALLGQRYCTALLDRRLAEIGVSRQGDDWRIALAKPLLSSELADWRAAGKEVLSLVNRARAEPRTCGKTRFAAAAPLEWNAELASAAHDHSQDMAQRDYFAHRGQDGSQVGDRAAREGYPWRQIGENIAAGQGSPKQVVSGWIASPEHCANIMEGGFAQMGAAYAVNPDSERTIYWTQVFGTPRR